MSDEELCNGLRQNALWVTTHDAADRIEALIRERDLWMETAAMHLRAEQAFLSWLRAAGEHLHDEGVTICDDGTDSGWVLSAKVPECVGLLKSRAEAAEAALKAMCEEFRGHDLPYGSKAYLAASEHLAKHGETK